MLIKNGTIITGEGKKRFRSDIRIDKNRIAQIGELTSYRGEEVIDALGLIVAPGGVDINCHSDIHGTLFSSPSQASLIRQGVTSVLVGNKGYSLAPVVTPYRLSFSEKKDQPEPIMDGQVSFGDYLDDLRNYSFGVNVASLVGYSTLQRAIAQNRTLLSKKDEQNILNTIRRSIGSGAFGVSLDLASQMNEPSNEMMERIMKIIREQNALYSITHPNSQDSIEGILSLAKENNINLQFSDIDLDNISIDKLSDSNIHFDTHPYTVRSRSLYSIVPSWALEKQTKSIKSNSLRKKLVKELNEKAHILKDTIISSGSVPLSWIGKKIGNIASSQNKTEGETIVDLLSMGHDNIVLIGPIENKTLVDKATKHPRGFISVGGAGYDMENISMKDNVAHPGSFGAIPIFLKNHKDTDLEKAINKISYGPAKKIGLDKRGRIKENYFADIVLWDLNAIESFADFNNPYQYPSGVEMVIVNGGIAYKKDENGITKLGTILSK